MSHLLKIIVLLLVSIKCLGQNDSILNSYRFEFEIPEEEKCDSNSSFHVNGNIECKLIFSQNEFEINNEESINIGNIKIATNDNSILLSENQIKSETVLFSESKKIFQIGYDTCYLKAFKKKDNKREYTRLMQSNNKFKMADWEIESSPQGVHCMDTDYHWAKISKDKENFITFSCLYNIKFLELDLNKDDKTEVYLISYIFCQGKFNIYRIDTKN